MNKLVVLSLGNGNLHNGFPTVTAQVWENEQPIKFTGCLPASPQIAELYKYWQLLYSAVYQRLDLNPRIEIEAGDVTNVSAVEFSHVCQRLSNELNIWLKSESFRHIEQQLRTCLHSDEEIRFVIETSDNLLKRLPWHLWQFFEDYPNAEVALSDINFQLPNKSITKKRKSKVRILAIFGNSKGIDLKKDRFFLEQLYQAEIEFLVEPRLEKLHDRLCQEWDILFFAGHSFSKEQPIIQLNQTEAIALDQLKYALRNAISKGLKLAIFNSCDGLGLAQALFDLRIPQVIVMREPVPDVVAQEFLKHFLATFSSGRSLYASVREARERLQKLEGNYPCATWLPVIYQNPAQMPTTWQELCNPKRSFKASYQRLQIVVLASVVVTALITGIRQLGIFQQSELQAFDSLVRLRSDEKPDPRLLIVTVTEKDIQKQNIKEMRSLSDAALTQLLKKLQPHQPKVIGLDIYRNFPVDSKYADLKTYLQDRRLIAVCEVGENDYKGIGQPPEVPPDQISFSDFPVDSDRFIRRQLLGMAPDPKSFCSTDTSFSFRVALKYLSSLGVKYKLTPENNWQIGNVVFKNLESDAGGYQQLDALGYQVLLNYRCSDCVAKQVSLYDILDGSLDDQLPNLVKDKIVLIGTTAKSFKDYFNTPLSAGQSEEEQPGVIIQAQMVSQIISAVLDGRSLLWWLPGWGETIWIWSWSFVGGILVGLRSPIHIGGAIVFALIILSGLCFVVLLFGGWIPLVPSALALVVTSGSLIAYTILQHKQV